MNVVRQKSAVKWKPPFKKQRTSELVSEDICHLNENRSRNLQTIQKNRLASKYSYLQKRRGITTTSKEKNENVNEKNVSEEIRNISLAKFTKPEDMLHEQSQMPSCQENISTTEKDQNCYQAEYVSSAHRYDSKYLPANKTNIKIFECQQKYLPVEQNILSVTDAEVETQLRACVMNVGSSDNSARKEMPCLQLGEKKNYETITSLSIAQVDKDIKNSMNSSEKNKFAKCSVRKKVIKREKILLSKNQNSRDLSLSGNIHNKRKMIKYKSVIKRQENKTFITRKISKIKEMKHHHKFVIKKKENKDIFTSNSKTFKCVTDSSANNDYEKQNETTECISVNTTDQVTYDHQQNYVSREQVFSSAISSEHEIKSEIPLQSLTLREHNLSSNNTKTNVQSTVQRSVESEIFCFQSIASSCKTTEGVTEDRDYLEKTPVAKENGMYVLETVISNETKTPQPTSHMLGNFVNKYFSFSDQPNKFQPQEQNKETYSLPTNFSEFRRLKNKDKIYSTAVGNFFETPKVTERNDTGTTVRKDLVKPISSSSDINTQQNHSLEKLNEKSLNTYVNKSMESQHIHNQETVSVVSLNKTDGPQKYHNQADILDKHSSGSSVLNTSSSVDKNKISDSTRPNTTSSSSRDKIDSACIPKSQRYHTAANMRTPVISTSSSIRNTSSSERTPSSRENDSCCVVALCEGRGHARGEVGLAALDVHHPYLVLCQISDSNNYINTLTKMNVLNPVQIIIPNTLRENQTSKLYQKLTEVYNNVPISSVQRRHYNDKEGFQQIKSICLARYSSVVYLVREKFYALSSAAALLRYIQFSENVVFSPNTLKVEYQGSQNTTVIDVNTANRLELVGCGRGLSDKNSLLGNLNHCFTSGGSRLLRANILQPPCDQIIIEQRLDAVEELVNNAEMLHTLQSIMPKFNDVEHLLTLSMYPLQEDSLKAAEKQFWYIMQLKTFLQSIPSLNSALEEAQSELLVSIRQNLLDPQFEIILKKLTKVIHEDVQCNKGPTSQVIRNFAIKPQINSLLDLARRTYSDTIDAMNRHVKELSEKYGLPLSVNLSSGQTFRIQLTLPYRQAVGRVQLPPTFKQIQKCRNSFYFMTDEMFSLSIRCKEAMHEIQLMSNVIFYQTLTEIKDDLGCLYQMCENVMQLDMIMSFAYVSSSVTDYVRPKFGEVLHVKNSRHPMLDFISTVEVTSNDVVSTEDSNFHIITGPNMSGKSIYIKQVAVLQIMAQLGSYVPATEATFRICDYILSRIGNEDSIECNASTFVMEIMEMNYIKQTVTAKSLVIIDELCRATSVEEGAALTWSLCEDIVNSKAFIFLATHYTFMTKFPEMYFSAINYHFEVLEERDKLLHTHHLLLGANKERNYGIKLAKHVNFLPSILQSASEISQEIQGEQREEMVPESEEISEDKELYRLVKDLLNIYQTGFLEKELCIKMMKTRLDLESEDSDIFEPQVLISECDRQQCANINKQLINVE